ncbi:MAG TPA: hypothetical protein PK293_13330, partial [Spirochaetota bacterium]|nr:hypothetical protein [Spirochaetota bacterium]
MKLRKYIYILGILIFLLSIERTVLATIDVGGVVVTDAEDGTAYGSPSANYYINGGAGAPYDFTVTVSSDETLYTGVTDVTLTIPATIPITISISPTFIGTYAATVGGGDPSGTATCTISGLPGSMTLVFHYTPSTSASEIANGAHGITASATSDDLDTETSAAYSETYGIVNTGITAGN